LTVHPGTTYSSEELKAAKYLLGWARESLALSIEYVEDEDGYIAVSNYSSVTSYDERPSQMHADSPYVSYNLHFLAFGGNHHQHLQGDEEEAEDNADTDEEEEVNDTAGTGEEENKDSSTAT
jgi:hypothetical protein